MIRSSSLKFPKDNQVSDSGGILTAAWNEFFRNTKTRLEPIGEELSFPITNNQSSVADIDGLVFDKAFVSAAFVDYVIQRVTTGGGAVELIEVGSFYCGYRPTSTSWSLVVQWTPGPDASGVTFSITSAGQVQYVSTNETGTASISRIIWRVRTLAGKHHSYSEAG